MILLGRNLSPFVRRVALWCAHQGRKIDRRELTVAGEDFIEIGKHNPVSRVPVLILEDGTHLIETFAICDYLEETAPEGQRLIPGSGKPRVECLQRLALANSIAEKSVAMVYEKLRRPVEFQWDTWQARLTKQIEGGFAVLDQTASVRRLGPEEYDGGDLAMVIAYHFAETAMPFLLEPGYPHLRDMANRAMDWPGVAETMPAM
ncbi:MAG: glutathione S-transferase family protein [Pseudomonadota bacterium]